MAGQAGSRTLHPGRIAWGEEPGTRPISIPHRYRRSLSVSPAIVRVWPHPSRRSLEPHTAPQSQIRLLAYKRRTRFELATSSLGRLQPYHGYGLQITHILLRGRSSVPHWYRKLVSSGSGGPCTQPTLPGPPVRAAYGWRADGKDDAQLVGRLAGLAVSYGRRPLQRRLRHADSIELIRPYRRDQRPTTPEQLAGCRRSPPWPSDHGPSGGCARGPRAYRAALSVLGAVGVSQAARWPLPDSGRGARRVLAHKRP